MHWYRLEPSGMSCFWSSVSKIITRVRQGMCPWHVEHDPQRNTAAGYCTFSLTPTSRRTSITVPPRQSSQPTSFGVSPTNECNVPMRYPNIQFKQQRRFEIRQPDQWSTYRCSSYQALLCQCSGSVGEWENNRGIIYNLRSDPGSFGIAGALEGIRELGTNLNTSCGTQCVCITPTNSNSVSGKRSSDPNPLHNERTFSFS